MKFLKNISLIIAVSIALVACKKYEAYDVDYNFSAVYFASQKPLRTIVGYDNMTFKVGVTLSGLRENTKDQTIKYTIDPTLLTTVAGASAFKLLPANYYTLSDNSTMIIASGKIIGDVTVTLNRALFTADPDATKNVYAIPLKIVSSTTDSVLRGNSNTPAKDYTILVVKYISPYHGTYYHKGIETTGTTSVSYTKKDLSQNATWDLSTLTLNEVQTTGAGTRTTPRLKFQINNSNVSVIDLSLTAPNNVAGTGTYNAANKSFFLNYNYKSGTTSYDVKDTLIIRQAPELDLRFEEW